jgi:hypothetical protein
MEDQVNINVTILSGTIRRAYLDGETAQDRLQSTDAQASG